jgi:hypothetical protein
MHKSFFSCAVGQQFEAEFSTCRHFQFAMGAILAELDEIAKQGRAYRHEKCGADTLITNGEFVHICNPLSLVLGAYCATCGRPGRISDFTWIDTGEPIVEYRKRMFAMVPSFWRTYFRGGWAAYGMLLGGGIRWACAGRREICWYRYCSV